MRMLIAGALALALVGCGKDKEGGGGADKKEASSTDKATPEECQKAYEHLAELEAKDGRMTKEQLLDINKGNIESCPKMVTKEGIACMMAMTEYSLTAWNDCAQKGRKK